MANQPCGRCPALQAQVAELRQYTAALERQIEHLRHRLAHLLGGVRATVTFIEQELAEPSMPRRNLIGAIVARLTYAIDTAEGKRP